MCSFNDKKTQVPVITGSPLCHVPKSVGAKGDFWLFWLSEQHEAGRADWQDMTAY